jgi:hypothetical protein
MKQITIVTQDRPGLVADISEVLTAAGVNIESLVAEQVGALATVIMTVDNYDSALRAISKMPLSAVTEDAILVRIDDRPGALAGIARRFKDAGVNMRSIRILCRDGGRAIVAISTDRTAEALALVRDVLIS